MYAGRILLAQDTGTRAAYCVHVLSAEQLSASSQPAIPISIGMPPTFSCARRDNGKPAPRLTNVVMHHGSGDRLQLEKALYHLATIL
jgi:hypothetical protein